MRIDRVVGAALVTILASYKHRFAVLDLGRGHHRAIRDQTSKFSIQQGTIVSCSTAAADAPTLTQVETRFVTGLLEPFGVAFMSNSSGASSSTPSSPAADLRSNPTLCRVQQRHQRVLGQRVRYDCRGSAPFPPVRWLAWP